MCETKLPGPQKYVKYWPKTTIDSQTVHYFTYFRGPGTSKSASTQGQERLRLEAIAGMETSRQAAKALAAVQGVVQAPMEDPVVS